MHEHMVYVLGWIGLAMAAAVLFGAVAKRFRQPQILGALIGGVVIGIVFTNTEFMHELRSDHGIAEIVFLAEFAAMLLLFKAGLESNIDEIRNSLKGSMGIAIIGIVTPMFGGFLYAWYVVDVPWQVAFFQGGVFAATSVGITAAVLNELGVTKKSYFTVIMTAAVIDDILGLGVLMIAEAMNASGGLDAQALGMQIGGSLIFVIGIPFIGYHYAGSLMKRTSGMNPEQRESLILAFMFLYGAGALYFGLAAIIGAYFAGVALDEPFFAKKDGPGFLDKKSKEVEHFIDSLIVGFGPIFFVYAGCVVNPAIFLNPTVLMHGIAFTLIAMLGKLACGLLAKQDRLIVGVGMSPRGEVGIVFATIGLQKGILTPDLFGASMIMVLLTTMAAPPILNYLIQKAERDADPDKTDEVPVAA